ncbi:MULTISPECIES: hypothetical protein [unclassified Streptomyces]|uniref:hypothetical protein n=1 Tax=unclassified Streptomyces TaxID=2593676 RepID=UPI002DD92C0C|nr:MULTISPECIES: hypothetical protein [unclassified Streptomyces]WSA91556.1 hypothetical protein OIE63_08265 [Streptomyces sp. NBC_01795]WSB75926.1 hypothetical protein OHB04_09070 [Streptomyces sp. NBC_01775]WSS15798.1 hypothetical protein OG533_30870 [Streptomyces sp. NBC_01186]WSS44637.1 hypothetical protein OG220_31650 [Streptomyces sp. NBC_01187]
MDDYLREIVLGVIAAAVTATAGWFARTYLWRRRLRRKQRFFGMPEHSECLLVVNRDAGTSEWAVARNDVFALLELSALIKDCGANADVVAHDAAQQGFGERTEFCLGGPVSNRRMAAHLQSLLPGVQVNTEAEPGPDRGAFAIGSERYRLENGTAEHVLLARLTAGQSENVRPVFLICGQRSITNQAAARYLARNHVRLARKHGQNGNFCLLLKVVNSQAYGPDVVELLADVTRAATTPRRGGHRAL